MKKLNQTAIMILALSIFGCASNSGENPSDRNISNASASQSRDIKCNAGEILVCKARDSHRVSDGRYGRNNKRNQKCGCQPEADLSKMGMDVLGNGQ
tara:strand:+ start:295 stop:585 length:291 start_codon:yes stop_codon:yes gene_type:complete